MTTTVQAVYDGGVLRLRRELPLPSPSEVLGAPANGGAVSSAPVVWPDVAARLRELYGATVLANNPVLTARNDERY